ncbi:MAG: hypothetical protein LUE98_04640 [Tannerellaceae bacterium]|nr:hypothetical protein [Tannerellaceae bacterium]
MGSRIKNLFVEPCVGCFENRLRELSETDRNELFISAGDFTLSRLISALAVLTYGGEMIVTLWSLNESTRNTLNGLVKQGALKSWKAAEGNHLYAIWSENERNSLLVTGGFFFQDQTSMAYESFTMVNDPVTKEAFVRVIKKVVSR